MKTLSLLAVLVAFMLGVSMRPDIAHTEDAPEIEIADEKSSVLVTTERAGGWMWEDRANPLAKGAERVATVRSGGNYGGAYYQSAPVVLRQQQSAAKPARAIPRKSPQPPRSRGNVQGSKNPAR